MALSATFTANFSSFYDAVDKADAKLKDFGAGADKVGGRLNALANSFSGQKVIQDATLMAKAVESIGGTSKLTEKELARLGSTANEAVAKMKALGMEVPKNLQAIADQTKGANKATTDWMGTFTKMAGVIGVTFSVGAITNFIGSVFDAASAVKDLSDQWGFSTTAVQKWIGAAKQSGVEADSVGKSVHFLTEKLSESSAEYDALLANIGLSGDALRKMPLEDAYRTVLAALTDIKDETLQYDLALGIIGPSAKRMIGAIRDGLVEATDAQAHMSQETIRRLDEAQAAWEKFANAVVIYSGEMLASMMDSAQKMTQSWGTFFRTVGGAAKAYFTGGSMAAAFNQTDEAAAGLSRTLGKTGGAIQAVASHGEDLNKGLKTTAQIQEEVRKKDEARKKGLKDLADAQDKAAKKEEDYNKQLDATRRVFEGGDLIGKAELYVEALQDAIPIQKMTTKQQVDINKVMWEAIVAYERAGQMAPKAMYDIYTATARAAGAIQDLKESLPTGDWIKPGSIDLGQALTLDPGYFQEQLDMYDVMWATAVKKLQTPTKSFNTSISDLAKSFAQLGNITGGTMGEIAGQIGNVVGAMDLAREASATFRAGLESLGSGSVGQGLGQLATGAFGAAAAFLQATENATALEGALSGAAIGASFATPAFAAYGAAVGFAAGYLRGFFNEMEDRKKLADMKADVVAAAGGMTAFAERAQHAGASYIDFVNAASGGELEAAFNRITEAIQYQKASIDVVIATAEKYGITLEELGPAMQRNELDEQAQQLYQDFQVLNAAGLETVLITERMSESVNDYVQQAMAMGMEVPSAMRPMLEAMARSGQLLDANGEAITDLEDSGISFALTMSDGFKALINEVRRLTDAIGRELGASIRDIPDPEVTGRVSWAVDPIPSQPHGDGGGGGGGGEELEEYQQGTGGFKNFGKGTPVMLHGWEAVVPRDDASATVTGAMGGPAAAPATSIVINAQGAFFETPGDLQRLAAKVEDALNAKHGLTHRRRAS